MQKLQSRFQFIGLGTPNVIQAPPVAPPVAENTTEVDKLIAQAMKQPTKVKGSEWAKVRSRAAETGKMGGALSVHPDIQALFKTNPEQFPFQATVNTDEITLRPAANGKTVYGTFSFAVPMPNGATLIQNCIVPRETSEQVKNGAPVTIHVEQSEQGFRYSAEW